MTKTLDFSRPHLLRSEAEYDQAVARLQQLLDAGGLRTQEEVDFLALLIEQYDRQHYAIPGALTPQAVVDFLLEQHGQTRADLAEAFGGRSRVSNFFAGKRELSKAQLTWLHQELGAPLELLLLGPDATDRGSGTLRVKAGTEWSTLRVKADAGMVRKAKAGTTEVRPSKPGTLGVVRKDPARR